VQGRPFLRCFEDACQIAWVILLRRQPDRGPMLFGWLRTVAIHEAYRLSRAERRDIRLEDLGDRGAWDELLGGRAALEDVVEARRALRVLAGLPERQHEYVSLLVAGFRYREIGELAGGRTMTKACCTEWPAASVARARRTEAMVSSASSARLGAKNSSAAAPGGMPARSATAAFSTRRISTTLPLLSQPEPDARQRGPQPAAQVGGRRGALQAPAHHGLQLVVGVQGVVHVGHCGPARQARFGRGQRLAQVVALALQPGNVPQRGRGRSVIGVQRRVVGGLRALGAQVQPAQLGALPGDGLGVGAPLGVGDGHALLDPAPQPAVEPVQVAQRPRLHDLGRYGRRIAQSGRAAYVGEARRPGTRARSRVHIGLPQRAQNEIRLSRYGVCARRPPLRRWTTSRSSLRSPPTMRCQLSASMMAG